MKVDAAREADSGFVYAAGAAVDADRRLLFAVRAPEPERIHRAVLRWNLIWCGCSNVAARAELL